MMLEPPLPVFPSETDMLDVLLGTPGLFALTQDEISALRALRLQLRSTLIDVSTRIHQAELLRASQPDSADTAQRADAIVADQMAAGEAARAMVNAELRRVLNPAQYRRAFCAFEHSTKVAENEPASKDQKTIEIETAVMVTERLVSWAKLFAWVVAVPAGLLIVILTVIGISKFSDLTALTQDSETKLRSTVAQATKNAETLANKVVELNQKQIETRLELTTLTGELKTVTMKLLQDLLAKFQAFLMHLGYVPGQDTIKVQLLTKDSGVLAYYDKGTIFASINAINDPEIFYREYLHHVLLFESHFTGHRPRAKCPRIRSGGLLRGELCR